MIYTSITVLCEDSQHWVFVRNYFMAKGYASHQIRPKVAPVGKGAGEQFVREQYPIEVKRYRKKCNNIKIALIVVIDADTQSVNERLTAFENELVKQSIVPPRSTTEKIAFLIPKRNIETWIEYLNKEVTVIEEGVKKKGEKDEDKYPKLTKESDCLPGVLKLAKIKDINELEPQPVPLSLVAAIAELRRVV